MGRGRRVPRCVRLHPYVLLYTALLSCLFTSLCLPDCISMCSFSAQARLDWVEGGGTKGAAVRELEVRREAVPLCIAAKVLLYLLHHFLPLCGALIEIPSRPNIGSLNSTPPAAQSGPTLALISLHTYLHTEKTQDRGVTAQEGQGWGGGGSEPVSGAPRPLSLLPAPSHPPATALRLRPTLTCTRSGVSGLYGR